MQTHVQLPQERRQDRRLPNQDNEESGTNPMCSFLSSFSFFCYLSLGEGPLQGHGKFPDHLILLAPVV